MDASAPQPMTQPPAPAAPPPDPVPPVVPPMPPRNSVSFVPFIIGAVVLAVLGSAAAYFLAKNPGVLSQPKACTLEAKLCPDGSSVGRQGPNCEFAACPGEGSGSPITPTSMQGEPEVNKSGLLVPVTYGGEGSTISPEFSSYVVFKNCRPEVAQCTYYFLAKDKVASYPKLQGITVGDKLMITGKTVSRGSATGNVLVELTDNIRISR